MNSDNIWLDPLYLDDLLSEEEKSIRKTTHDYCNKNLFRFRFILIQISSISFIMVNKTKSKWQMNSK